MTNSDSRIGSYIESGYNPEQVYLSDEVYSQVLDAIVVACADIVLVNDGKVLLGKRAWHPQADWWIIGGRMRPGDEIGESAARNTKRELGLDIAPDRFKYLTTFSAGWHLRRKEPADHGTHTVSIVMTAEVSSEEASAIKLNEEYTDQQWISPRDILSDGTLHPALHQCARALS